LHKVRSDSTPTTQIVIVGDIRQAINAFRGAKVDYLENPANFFSSKQSHDSEILREWREIETRVSFRLTPEIARFVNEHILNENVIQPFNAIQGNEKPISYAISGSNKKKTDAIDEALEKFVPSDIMILTPSIRYAIQSDQNPINQAIEHLCQKEIPLYVGIDQSRQKSFERRNF
jgi:superfamily I DNA/RNA helicase